MKRRDFLTVSSLGLAAAVLPKAAGAQSAPCPPGSVAASGGQSVVSQCGEVASSGSAPAWFAGQATRTWKGVAADATVSNCFYSPFLTMSGNYGDRNIFNDYSGATVDQGRREMLMVANGGHADYLGNEGYALALWADSPYWYGLNDPVAR